MPSAILYLMKLYINSITNIGPKKANTSVVFMILLDLFFIIGIFELCSTRTLSLLWQKPRIFLVYHSEFILQDNQHEIMQVPASMPDIKCNDYHKPSAYNIYLQETKCLC